MSEARTLGVLFVCLGNICRSPTAHGVFLGHLDRSGLAGRVRVDSAGTGDYHVGEPPDPRTRAAAAGRGYDLSALRARQVQVADFDRFDYLLAMDQGNLEQLRRLVPDGARARLGLFLDYAAGQPLREVPDPYYGGPRGFDQVLDLVEAASAGLLDELRARLDG